jgi:hypothetical protein
MSSAPRFSCFREFRAKHRWQTGDALSLRCKSSRCRVIDPIRQFRADRRAGVAVGLGAPRQLFEVCEGSPSPAPIIHNELAFFLPLGGHAPRRSGRLARCFEKAIQPSKFAPRYGFDIRWQNVGHEQFTLAKVKDSALARCECINTQIFF